MKNKRHLGIVGIVALLLLIPLIAMQFTNEIRWTLSDFTVAGILLLGTGFLGELALRKNGKKTHRIAICIALLVLPRLFGPSWP